MPNRIMEWMEALALLGAEGVEPAEAQAACARIEALERGRAVRRCADFRLLGLASGGEPDCPLAWLLRYAMGRSLAALADPECKPGFSLRAARTLLGERTNAPLTLLAGGGSEPLAGGLLSSDGEGRLSLAHGLAAWMVGGQVRAPGLEPSQPRDWLVQQPPVQAAAARLAGLLEANDPPLVALTGAEPLLAAAVAAAVGQVRGRPLRCWALSRTDSESASPLTALRWVGAVEGFDPFVVLQESEDESWPAPPAGAPCAALGAKLWIAVQESIPSQPWLRDGAVSIDLSPLRASIALPGQDKPGKSVPSRRPRRPSLFGFELPFASRDVTDLVEADRRQRLDSLQRAVFPDHDPSAEPSHDDPSGDEVEAHLSPALWRPSEQTLDHLVLPEPQQLALRNAAQRAAAGDRCVILLHGAPGTGKSMAARCLAGSAGLPVYALEPHLSRDKWFGEQERKLAEVFEALVRKPAVLIIDEVDGWLGRREGSAAQVGAAHISECSTLLLQLERYRGAAVLTTNRVASLDPALQRRVDVDLHLELPGPAERMALWSIALGEECPLRSDELCVLACVPLSGGDIAATVREVRLKRGVLTVVALVAAARERARRASLWG